MRHTRPRPRRISALRAPGIVQLGGERPQNSPWRVIEQDDLLAREQLDREVQHALLFLFEAEETFRAEWEVFLDAQDRFASARSAYMGARAVAFRAERRLALVDADPEGRA